MRSLCVLASFESLQRGDEPSYFATYLPIRGIELVTVSYDPYSDVHTAQTSELVKADEAVLPEVEDLTRAFHHCTGTVCRSDEREFRFTFTAGAGGLLLSKLSITELPPCDDKPAIPAP